MVLGDRGSQPQSEHACDCSTSRCRDSTKVNRRQWSHEVEAAKWSGRSRVALAGEGKLWPCYDESDQAILRGATAGCVGRDRGTWFRGLTSRARDGRGRHPKQSILPFCPCVLSNYGYIVNPILEFYLVFS